MRQGTSRHSVGCAIRVLVIDDHQILLGALEDWLRGVPLVEVVGVFVSARAALGCLSERQPDLVLLDANMPVMGGLEAVEPIKRWNPSVRVVIMSFNEVHLAIARRMTTVDKAIDKYHLREQFPLLIQEVARARLAI
ncbi:MAG: Response regulator transcription factor [Nitrospira sp.]|nr:MAG: Response regulator transcription factor [Nitrospira sp.]